jgi:hypothetical protein
MSDSAAIILKSTRRIAPGVDGFGNAIADALTILDRMAKKLKVPSPNSFLFEDPSLYEELAEELPAKYAKRLAKQKQWHRCSDGVTTFTALLGAFDGEDKSKWMAVCEDDGVDLDDLRSDLKTFLKALQKAAKKDGQFHLDVG